MSLDTRDELIETNRQHIDAWSVFARNAPSGVVDERPGVMVTLHGGSLALINAAFLLGPARDVADLERRLASAHEMAGQRTPGWVFTACEEWLPDGAAAGFERAGRKPYMRVTGMVAPALRPPRRALPSIELRRVDSAAARRAVAEINARCYGFEGEAMAPWLYAIQPERFWEGLIGVLGYVDGEPVATATAMIVNDCTHVVLVATLP
ncbi:MAG TPA: hypothetical protein VLS89_10325, partial [Candidatus Nanopelagicales bacterium]|nr:hypothetical protein [Candidatus Nanopelagicales bacterium]